MNGRGVDGIYRRVNVDQRYAKFDRARNANGATGQGCQASENARPAEEQRGRCDGLRQVCAIRVDIQALLHELQSGEHYIQRALKARCELIVHTTHIRRDSLM